MGAGAADRRYPIGFEAGLAGTGLGNGVAAAGIEAIDAVPVGADPQGALGIFIEG